MYSANNINGFNRRSPAPRTVDGMPYLKPLRTRFSPNGTKHNDSPQGTPKLNKWSKRRRRLFLQMALLTLIGILMFRQADKFHSVGNESDVPGPTRKRSLITDGSASSDHQLGSWPLEDRQDTLAQPVAQNLPEITGEEYNISMFPSNSSISEVFAHPTSGPTGETTSYFYRFTNVRISKNGHIDFYGGLNSSQSPAERVFDILAGDGSASPQQPTAIRFAASAPGEKPRVIKVHYRSSSMPASACKNWIHGPSMIIHTANPSNVWGTWIDGLLPTFQTLRELGYLPLMQISPDGKVDTLDAGLIPGECPKVIDPTTGVTRPSVDCTQHRTSAAATQTTTETCGNGDMWCVVGVWPHIDYVRAPHPTLLYTNERVVDNNWGALYSAIGGGGLHAWDDEEGTCLNNLIVGFSKTLDVREHLRHGGEIGAASERQERISKALGAFGGFMRSALRRLEENNAIEFDRYTITAAEKLRLGITHGFGRYFDMLYRPHKLLQLNQNDTLVYDEWKFIQHEYPWVLDSIRDSITPKEDEEVIAQEASRFMSPSPLGPPPGHALEASPLPIVTYISLYNNLSNAILNDKQVLRYIYWRYNVTIKVTTMCEHEAAAARLLNVTDVLIGPVGPFWANVVFLKPGAVTMQLHPYGSRRKDGSLMKGGDVETLVHLRHGTHIDWVNPHASYSFFRQQDFSNQIEVDSVVDVDEENKEQTFREHPTEPDDEDDGWKSPNAKHPHPAWLHANTYADLNHLGPYIDEVMKVAGIPKMDPSELTQIVAADQQAEEEAERAKLRRQEQLAAAAATGVSPAMDNISKTQQEQPQNLEEEQEDSEVLTNANIDSDPEVGLDEEEEDEEGEGDMFEEDEEGDEEVVENDEYYFEEEPDNSDVEVGAVEEEKEGSTVVYQE